MQAWYFILYGMHVYSENSLILRCNFLLLRVYIHKEYLVSSIGISTFVEWHQLSLSAHLIQHYKQTKQTTPKLWTNTHRNHPHFIVKTSPSIFLTCKYCNKETSCHAVLQKPWVKVPKGDPTSSHSVIHCFAEQAFQTQHVILCSFPNSQG